MTSSPVSLLPEENRGAMQCAAQSGAAYPGGQLEVLLHRLITMVRVCAYPKCKNRMSHNTPYSFHRLPLSNGEMLKLWLIVLQMDANTPVQTLRLADHRVCSAHSSQDDYCQPKKRRNPVPKHLFLKKTAVPRVERATDTVEVRSEHCRPDGLQGPVSGQEC